MGVTVSVRERDVGVVVIVWVRATLLVEEGEAVALGEFVALLIGLLVAVFVGGLVGDIVAVNVGVVVGL